MESKGKNRTLNDFSVLKIKKFREWMLSRITNDDVIKFNNEFVTDLRYIQEILGHSSSKTK